MEPWSEALDQAWRRGDDGEAFELPCREPVDRHLGGGDIAAWRDREVSEDPAVDSAPEELAVDRCPRAVGAGDGVEQELGRLGGVHGVLLGGLAEPGLEARPEARARAREHLLRDAGRADGHALARGPRVVCESRAREAVRGQDLDVLAQPGEQVLDQQSAVVVETAAEEHAVGAGPLDLPCQAGVARPIQRPVVGARDADAELLRSLSERAGDAGGVEVAFSRYGALLEHEDAPES